MKTAKKYLITLLSGLAVAALIAWSKDLFSQPEPAMIFHILTDSFFVVGVVITSAGLLIFSSNEGTFDMLSYGVQAFADMFRKKSQKKYETYYDFKEARAGKKIPFGFLLISGVAFLAVSFLMLYFYHQYS